MVGCDYIADVMKCLKFTTLLLDLGQTNWDVVRLANILMTPKVCDPGSSGVLINGKRGLRNILSKI